MAEMARPSRIALIGHGMVAETHVAAIHAAEPLSLAGVLGRDPERARAFATTAGCDCVYPDLAALCADETLDFALVVTPPDARLEIVEALVTAGIPILLEKPVERDLARARQIVDLAAAAKVPLGVVFQHRARVVSTQLREMITGGILGDLATVEIRVPWWREQNYYDAPGRGTYARDGGGVMITQAIHTLDLACWLLGPVAEVQAMMHRTPLHDLEAEDWAGALLRFESGTIGALTATTAAFPGGAESLHLQGSRASADLTGNTLTVHYLDGRTEQFGDAAATGGGADPMAFTHAWHQALIEEFTQALRAGRAPLADGRSALAAHAVIDAMERAHAAKAAVQVAEL